MLINGEINEELDNQSMKALIKDKLMINEPNIKPIFKTR